jgi:hypothetical protein
MDVVGTLSAAITLVGLAKKAVTLVNTHTHHYHDRDSKIKTIKGELQSFAENAEMVRKVIETQQIFNDYRITALLQTYKDTILSLHQKLQAIYAESKTKFFGPARFYIKLLDKDSEISNLRSRLRSHMHDIHFRFAVLANDATQRTIQQLDARVEQEATQHSLRHRSSEESLHAIFSEVQDLRQELASIRRGPASIEAPAPRLLEQSRGSGPGGSSNAAVLAWPSPSSGSFGLGASWSSPAPGWPSITKESSRQRDSWSPSTSRGWGLSPGRSERGADWGSPTASWASSPQTSGQGASWGSPPSSGSSPYQYQSSLNPGGFWGRPASGQPVISSNSSGQGNAWSLRGGHWIAPDSADALSANKRCPGSPVWDNDFCGYRCSDCVLYAKSYAAFRGHKSCTVKVTFGRLWMAVLRLFCPM